MPIIFIYYADIFVFAVSLLIFSLMTPLAGRRRLAGHFLLSLATADCRRRFIFELTPAIFSWLRHTPQITLSAEAAAISFSPCFSAIFIESFHYAAERHFLSASSPDAAMIISPLRLRQPPPEPPPARLLSAFFRLTAFG
jgi:hypothetical protein